MPRLKVEDDELDIEALEEAEYTEGDYESYSGERPPKGTILAGFVKKMWWTYTTNDDPMFKILFVADGNEGDEEEYEGCPIWENAALIPTAKFKWAPFMETFGITLKDVKTKLYVGPEDDPGKGAPIEKIGTWKPGSDDSYCRVLVDQERYNNEWQARIGKWLDYEPGEEEEEPEEPEPPARPTKGRGTSGRAKAGSTTQKAAPARGRRAKPEPQEEPDEPDDEPEEEPDEDEPEEKPAPRRTASRARSTKAPAKPATKAPARGARSRRQAAQEVDDEPPF